MAQTLYDKIWDAHTITTDENNVTLLYIDRHLVHEVTSPQAFDGLRLANRVVHKPENTLAVADHNVPTENRQNGISDPESKLQIDTLAQNTQDFNVPYFPINDIRQGIVHIVGPEQGFTLPGTTVVCGDSHTSTHGAFGALAHGIGTSEVEHVLATQTLRQTKSKNMLVTVNGYLSLGVNAKDVILTIIGKIGTAGATGYVIEYAGSVFENMSLEERMTVCNMSIEAGAKAGLIAPDEKTFDYFYGRPMSPKGDMWDKAVAYWKTLYSDKDATFDKELIIDAADIAPSVTWGTSPEQVLPITAQVPSPDLYHDETKRASVQRALDYMGLEPNMPLNNITINKVFIGSCTNGRIEDLRAVAHIAKGRKVAEHIYAMIVPGSGLVKAQAEQEGLDKVFIDAGFDWREPGCSMCLAMNADKLAPYERCASTSNRNFEGRQGRDGRTHLLSPAMAAAAAITGKLTDVREFL